MNPWLLGFLVFCACVSLGGLLYDLLSARPKRVARDVRQLSVDMGRTAGEMQALGDRLNSEPTRQNAGHRPKNRGKKRKRRRR